MYNPQTISRGHSNIEGTLSQAGAPGEALGSGQPMLTLRDLFQVLLRRIRIILLVVVLLVGTVLSYTLVSAPEYEASILILVGQERVRTEPGSLMGDVQGLQQLTQTMAEGVESRPIAEAVTQQLGLPTTTGAFLGNLSARPVRQTQFVRVSYRDVSPERAQQTVNAVGEVFSEQVSRVSPSANAVTATVWESAEVPDEPASPNLVLNLAFALVMGSMLGVGLAFLLEYLDDSWRSPEEAEQVSGVPTFGVIPEFDMSAGKKRGG